MADEFTDPAQTATIVSSGGRPTATDEFTDPGGGPSYPDMTPGPPRTPILSTSFHSVPSKERDEKLWDYGLMPPVGRLSGLNTRVGTAMKETYRDTPNIVPETGQDWTEQNLGWMGRNVVSPAITGINAAGKGLAAAGTGVTANLAELASGGNPRLARDVNAALTVLPVAQAHMPPVGGPVVRPEPKLPPPGAPIVAPPGPVSLPQLTKAVEQATPPNWRVVAPGEEHVPGRDYRMNQTTGQREVNVGGPVVGPDNLTIPKPPADATTVPTRPQLPPTLTEALPTGTIEEAMKVYEPQIKAAEGSDFRLTPKFTEDWTGTLDKYGPTSRAGVAVNPDLTPVQKLVAALRRTHSEDAPLDNIKSIQETEQRIRLAIEEQSGPNGLPSQVREMEDILHKFRDHYTKFDPDHYTGSPEGVQAYKDSLQSYAAVSRMRDIQDLIDRTEGNPNRNNLIATRVNNWLSDKRNTKGWSDAEIAEVRKAVAGGVLPELVRTIGSRLVGIGGAAAGGIPGMLAAVPAQVGISYMAREGQTAARLGALQRAIGMLGERVAQPGTVPATRVGPVPPQAAISAARYAPLVGLLGETANQPRRQDLLNPAW